MKHEDFRKAALGDAFEALEQLVLPSLEKLINNAAGAQPGLDAEARAETLRELAAQLDELTAIFGQDLRE